MLQNTADAILALVNDKADSLDVTGREMYDSPRLVTREQEIAYRLCHQDHFGLTRHTAASLMGVTVKRLNALLANMRLNTPQLFPVLPPKASHIYQMFVQDGMTMAEIADELDITIHYIRFVLQVLYDSRKQSGLYFKSDARRRLSYMPWMDKYVIEVW
jgi:hypothetical protein